MAEAKTVSFGSYVDYTPAAAVAAGTVVVQGDLVGIATRAIEANTLGALAVAGIFDIVKAGETEFTAGAKVYWDGTNHVAVTTDGSGANKLVGKATQAAADGDTTVRVRLSQ